MKKYWIKERYNPQFKEPYYVGMGQLSVREARKHEKTIYGENTMLSFDTEAEYKEKINQLLNSDLKAHTTP